MSLHSCGTLKVFIYCQKRRKLGLGFRVECGILDCHESWSRFSWRIPLSALLIWASDNLCLCPRPLDWGLHESRGVPFQSLSSSTTPNSLSNSELVLKNYLLANYPGDSLNLNQVSWKRHWFGFLYQRKIRNMIVFYWFEIYVYNWVKEQSKKTSYRNYSFQFPGQLS